MLKRTSNKITIKREVFTKVITTYLVKLGYKKVTGDILEKLLEANAQEVNDIEIDMRLFNK